ncbi:hypothetical protein FS749_015988 [Ceratobasidium sp. UAMH 11750]|nr:hypothetical protein FS749_015988 [Ceratobasidium sp. UAMH 11750]
MGGALRASSPPSGAIIVGSGGKYSTLAAALNDPSSNIFFVYSGTYAGQTTISRTNVKIYGQSNSATSYSSNTVTFTNRLAASAAGGNAKSSTIRILGAGVSLHNLNIANTYTQAQAVALSVEAKQFRCYACQIKGYQDTLLAEKGAQFYGKSYVEE